MHHLNAVLVPRALDGLPDIVDHPHQSRFDSLDDVANANIWHVVHAYAVPVSKDTMCPRDDKEGCAYVDTLHHEDDVGRATALLSYSWGYRVTEVSGALSAWTKRGGRDPRRTRIWICSLCLNQHRMADASVEKDLQKEFGERVVAIGRILPMLDRWSDPGYVKRAWCLFELFTAIRSHAVEIDIILSPEQAQSFHDGIMEHGYGVIDAPLASIDSASAKCEYAADLLAIRAAITSFSGGFDTLDEVVKQRLRQWFESQGGIKVASTSSGVAPSNSKASNSTSLASSQSKTATVRSMPMMQLSDDQQYRGYQDVQVGDRVTVSGYQGAGVVRFVGAVHTDGAHRVGVELDNPVGRHSGVVEGRHYFKCPAKRGVLAGLKKVTLLAKRHTSGGGSGFGFGFDVGVAEPTGEHLGGNGSAGIAFGFGTATDAAAPGPSAAADSEAEHVTRLVDGRLEP